MQKENEDKNKQIRSKIEKEFALKPIEPTTKNYICLNKYSLAKAREIVKRENG